MKRVLATSAFLALALFMAWYVYQSSGFWLAFSLPVLGAIGVVVAASSLAEAQMVLSRLLWTLPLLVGLLVHAFAQLFTDRTGTDRFYELVSQILPILILALAVEGRWSRRPRVRDTFELVVATIVISFVVAGEIAALVAVETEPTATTFTYAVAGLAVGLIWVVELALIEWVGSDATSPSGGESDEPAGESDSG